MCSKENVSKIAAWLFYVFIIFEIIFMISPVALYYYSAYGPILNFFHKLPGFEWLAAFFLPHFSWSSFWLLNQLRDVGWIFFCTGFLVFGVCAGQIYYNKFTKRGAVTSGLYKYIRHPQYSAFMLMGLGTTLIWPRFFILITYITMLFLYFLLARKEERECIKKFGERYINYADKTSKFFPGDGYIIKFINIPIAVVPLFYIAVIAISLIIGFSVQTFSIGTLVSYLNKNTASISPAKIDKEKLEQLILIAETDPDVKDKLGSTILKSDLMLNYVIPAEWILPDLPVDDMKTSMRGHYQPEDYDQAKYKILFTKAIIPGGKVDNPEEIIANTIKRIPVLTVYVDYKLKKVIEIKTPPKTVLWGDIPTPIY